MSGPAYIPGAERLGPDSGGTMDGGPPRATWHTVECPPGRGYFVSMASYLRRESVWPQVLYDPQSDSLGQFAALNTSGRALRNAGSVRTNRTGVVNIQVEVCGRAAEPFTSGFDPASKPNFLKLIAAMRAWGIPDVWPAGAPQRYPGDHDDRDLPTWLGEAGHYGHSQVPGNDHGDPGQIDTAKVPPRGVAAPAGEPADPDAFPGAHFFGPGAANAHVTRLGQMLIARGGARFYQVGPGPSWGAADREATRAFQLAQGWSGPDADGYPGPATWRLLVTGQGRDIPAVATRPAVSTARVIAAAKADPPKRGTPVSYAGVRHVEDALAAEGLLEPPLADGHFGTATVQAYAAWQRRLGYAGTAADGIPGPASLRRLGDRHGFDVTA